MTLENPSSGELANNPAAEAFFRILQAVGLVTGGMGASAAGEIQLLQQTSLSRNPSTLLPLGEILEALRRGLITVDQCNNVLQRYGFGPTAIEVIKALRAQPLDVGSLVELSKREAASPSQYLGRFAELGYSQEDAERLVSLGLYVPTAPDVVMFAVREVYNPEITRKYGSFTEFPEDAMRDFTRAGLPREEALKYWGAHWQLPSIEQAIHMYFRRAETGFQLSDLLELMKAQDVLPFYREKLLAIVSAPYTRVDVRRMHKLGILDLADVAQAYQELGYNDERAQNLALFTEQLNAQESDDALEPWRAGLRSRVVSMYQSRRLPEEDVREALSNLGYSAEQIAAFVTEAKFIRDAELFDDWAAKIQKLYVAGYWTRGQAIERMLELGFEEYELVDLFPVWDIERELREETAEERAEKDLTKTEIITAYKDAIMGEDDTRESLSALGYDDAEVTRLLRLADAAIAKQRRAEEESTMQTLYVAGKLGDSVVHDRLAALGMSAERVDALMIKWRAQIEAKIPELTVAQITAALRSNIIDESDADRRLTKIGYSAEDRRIIIALV